MKIFQSIRKPLRAVGIYPTQNIEESPFNWKNIFVTLFLCQFSILSLAHILFAAENLRDAFKAFYIFSSASVMVLISVELTRKIFKVVTSFENLIGTRKFIMITFNINYLIAYVLQSFQGWKIQNQR